MGIEPAPPSTPRAELSMSALDFACVAMSASRSFPAPPARREIVPPELDKPSMPKMYSPMTRVRSIPSYSALSPRKLYTAHAARARASLGTTQNLGGRDGSEQINLNRSHAIVSPGDGHAAPTRTLMCSRAGSPAWTALENYTIRTDLASGRSYACGGSYYSGPPGAAAESAAGTDDWACSSTGEPTPSFRMGVTGFASPRKRRAARSWLPEKPMTAPGRTRAAAAGTTPRGRDGKLQTRRVQMCSNLSRRSDRDSARSGRFQLTDGARVAVLPSPAQLCWSEKVEYRRRHPEVAAAEQEREEKDRKFAAKDRLRKLLAEQLRE